MKKLTSLFIAFTTMLLFCLSASAASRESTIPVKTLNEVLEDYRNAIKAGETYVDLSSYNIAYDAAGYADLWYYFTGIDGDLGSISFGKYNETYASFDIRMNNSYITGVNIEYDQHYRKEDGKCDKELVKDDQQIVSDRFNKAKALVNRNMSDMEKALVIYDFVITATDYSEPESINEYGDEVYSKDSYTVIGLLRDGKAICTAYAKLFAILMNEVGVPAVTVESTSLRHEWAMVNIDGVWYHCDPTWDDIVYEDGLTAFYEPNNDKWDIGAVGHKYFLKSDEEMKELDHPDWQITNTVNLDYSNEAPSSGNSGAFDEMFFSDKNETYYCVSAMNYINGNWYFADLNSYAIIVVSNDNEPEALTLPLYERPKYSFRYQNDLYVCTDRSVVRLNTIDSSFDTIIRIDDDRANMEYFSEMNIIFDEMTLVKAINENGDDTEFDVTNYSMDEVANIEAIDIESYFDEGETVSREDDDIERAPQLTRPGGYTDRGTAGNEDMQLLEAAQNAGKRISAMIYLVIATVFIIMGIVAIILAIKHSKKH